MTTKLTEDDQGYDSAIAACELSLRKMGLDYVGKAEQLAYEIKCCGDKCFFFLLSLNDCMFHW